MALFGSAPKSPAQSLTYGRDIAPILLAKCSFCHRAGEAAPMPLTSYDEVRPWIKSIKSEVQSHRMPPGFAEPRGIWANDLQLGDAELDALSRWIDDGAPRGDLEPPSPPAPPPEGWRLGPPDLIVNLDKVNIPGGGNDLNIALQIKLNLPEDRWLRAFDVRPGNRRALHHLVVFEGIDAAMIGRQVAAWAVGSPPIQYPDGVGQVIPKDPTYSVNLHYHPLEIAAADQTQLGFYFGRGELRKVVATTNVAEARIQIAPGQKDYIIHAEYFVNQDIEILSFLPHMHMRGRSMSYTALFPDGRTELLLRVPHYDFNWQWIYFLRRPISLPKGSRIQIEARYDNSADNPLNPDPAATVRYGRRTTDEMMFAQFDYIAAEGKQPKPFTNEDKIAMAESFLNRHRGAAMYSVLLSAGEGRMPMLWELPREGDCLWFIPKEGQMLAIGLEDFTWQGDEFRFRVSAIQQFAGSEFKGRITPEGTIEGKFAFQGISDPSGKSASVEGLFEGGRISSQ
ncbi:hypothetical protein HYR69_08025 [Candidatus Sumerlaeota bacterium]|nr:hypothetical protein [Candidatus Sumerlaeota bacterium]